MGTEEGVNIQGGKMFMKRIIFYVLAIIILPSTALALSYTHYQISSWQPEYPINGYANIQHDPIIILNGVIQDSPNYDPLQLRPINDLTYRFNLNYSITLDSGNENTGSGYVDISNSFMLQTDGSLSFNSSEDCWRIGDYSNGSGFGFVNVGLVWEFVNLLTSPITELPETFGLNHFEYDNYCIGSSSLGTLGGYGIIFTATPEPVPEPSTIILLGAGFSSFALMRRRFKK
jgi:hypothetical protein